MSVVYVLHGGVLSNEPAMKNKKNNIIGARIC